MSSARRPSGPVKGMLPGTERPALTGGKRSSGATASTGVVDALTVAEAGLVGALAPVFAWEAVATIGTVATAGVCCDAQPETTIDRTATCNTRQALNIMLP